MTPGWWVITNDSLMNMLQQVADGDTPDIVYAEFYANSEHEWPAEQAGEG